MTVADAIRSSNDGSGHSEETAAIASSGVSARGWIQAPITRVAFVSLATQPFHQQGPYAFRDSRPANESLHGELTALQLASAAAFWEIEDSLPE